MYKCFALQACFWNELCSQTKALLYLDVSAFYGLAEGRSKLVDGRLGPPGAMVLFQVHAWESEDHKKYNLTLAFQIITEGYLQR